MKKLQMCQHAMAEKQQLHNVLFTGELSQRFLCALAESTQIFDKVHVLNGGVIHVLPQILNFWMINFVRNLNIHTILKLKSNKTAMFCSPLLRIKHNRTWIDVLLFEHHTRVCFVPQTVNPNAV